MRYSTFFKESFCYKVDVDLVWMNFLSRLNVYTITGDQNTFKKLIKDHAMIK